MSQLEADRILSKTSPALRSTVLTIVGSLLVAVAAQITVPMWPVPMTLQTLAVLGVGAALGSRLGAAALALYAVEGAIGLPFFAGGKSGIFDQKLDYLLPSGSMGYVLGFILAAWLVGKIVEIGLSKSILRTLLATSAGAVVLYVPGLIWLAVWASKTQAMAMPEAVSAAQSWGLYPFIIGDAIKALIAALGVATVSKTLPATNVEVRK